GAAPAAQGRVQPAGPAEGPRRDRQGREEGRARREAGGGVARGSRRREQAGASSEARQGRSGDERVSKSIGHVELSEATDNWIATFPDGSKRYFYSRDAAVSAVLDAAVESGDVRVVDGIMINGVRL